jgi:methylated-DNA-[protein]-cysteine S-methyltransferase
MNEELKYTVFKTSQGWIGCLSSAYGLKNVTFPQPSPQRAFETLDGDIGHAAWAPDSFVKIISQFNRYFDRESRKFSLTLDLGDATKFKRQVWEATRSIPYGETRSYGWIAERIGKPGAVRAVGQALSRNPLPIIIPCHRVVASTGGLCGFGGGLEMKARLLRLEGEL